LRRPAAFFCARKSPLFWSSQKTTFPSPRSPPTNHQQKLRLRGLHLAGALPEWEPALAALRAALLADAPPVPILAAAAAALLLAYALYRALLPAARKVYLVDFAVHKGLDAWKFPKEWFLPQSAAKGKFTKDDLQFQEKILMRCA
jgi:hypothetical protein